jgi:hypothetical protein
MSNQVFGKSSKKNTQNNPFSNKVSDTKSDNIFDKISSVFQSNKPIMKSTSKKLSNQQFLGKPNSFDNYSDLNDSTKDNDLFENIFSNNKASLASNKPSLASNKPSLASNKSSLASNKSSLASNKPLSNKSETIKNSSFNLFGQNPSVSNPFQKVQNTEQNDNLKSSTINKFEKASASLPFLSFDFKSILFWFGILVLLAFLGFNIFKVLGFVTDNVANILKPILSFFGILTIDTAQKTVDVASTGTKGLVNTSDNFLTSGINFINNISQNSLSFLKNRINANNVDLQTNIDRDDSDDNEINQNNKINNDIKKNSNIGETSKYNSSDVNKLSDFIDNNFDNVNKFNSSDNKSCRANCSTKCNNESGSQYCNKHCDKYCDEVLPEPEPIIDNSRVQSNKASGKSGFCYVGEENGIRSCVKVTDKDVCVSGKVYHSKDICANPRLRQ